MLLMEWPLRMRHFHASNGLKVAGLGNSTMSAFDPSETVAAAPGRNERTAVAHSFRRNNMTRRNIRERRRTGRGGFPVKQRQASVPGGIVRGWGVNASKIAKSMAGTICCMQRAQTEAPPGLRCALPETQLAVRLSAVDPVVERAPADPE
jgi:hypothetical protein